MADTGSGALHANRFACQTLRAEIIQPIQLEFHAECDVAAVVYSAADDPDELLASFIRDLRAQGFDAAGLLQRRNPRHPDMSGPAEFFLIPDADAHRSYPEPQSSPAGDCGAQVHEPQLNASQAPLTPALPPQANPGEHAGLSGHIRKRIWLGEGASCGPLHEVERNSSVPSFLGEKDRMRGDLRTHQPDLALEDLGARLALALERRPDLLVLNRFGWLEAGGSGLLSLLARAVERDVPVAIAVPEGLFGRWLTVVQGLAVRLRCDRDSLDCWWDGVRGVSSAPRPHGAFCERCK